MARLLQVLGGFVLVAWLGMLAPVVSASPAADASVWSAEYFNNTTLAGPPVLLRGDADINFFWPEYTSPAPGFVNVDNYSVRWMRSIYFGTSGNWVFTTVNDDGMRVWVDDQITMDGWYDQGPTTHTGKIYLNAGWHLVKVEYYNRWLGGTARVSYALEGSFGDWQGEYFNNQYLSGAPTLTRNDTSINFNWASGSPDASIPADHFSVRWTRSVYFNAGNWRFTATADDGVRVWVDSSLVIDKWYDQPQTTHTGDITLTAGNHTVRMEYYDNTVLAVAQLSYAPVSSPPPPPTGAWYGQYFSNVSLAGPPALVRTDASLHFEWGGWSPGPGIPADYFSARWDSTQNLPVTGNYTVMVSSDDGVRAWIDGVLVVDAWYDHPPTLFTTTRYYTAGPHTVRVEFYERAGGAMVGFDLVPGSGPPPPPPPGEVIVDDKGPGWQAGGKSTSWRNAWTGNGGHSFWTYNNTYVAPLYNWARWYPTLPAAGNYEVFAYIPGGLASTTNARYWIYHNNQYNLAARAQAFFSNQWVSLGTYYFHAQGGENVSLADVTYECYLCRTLVWDAVKFVPR